MTGATLLLHNPTQYVSAETALFSALIKAGEDRAHVSTLYGDSGDERGEKIADDRVKMVG